MTSIHLHAGDLPFRVTGQRDVGIDTELTGLRLAHDRVCLIQISLDGGEEVHLVRPAVQPPSNLCALLEDPKICKVFHFARADLSFLIKDFDVRPRNIWCTKIAARLQPPLPTSLAGLCRELLDIELDKTIKLSDWSKPVLDDSQIQYAAADVIYLPQLKAMLGPGLTPVRRLRAKALFAIMPQIARMDTRAGRRLNLGPLLGY